MSIRVLIADDQQLVRSGFRVLLDAETDIEMLQSAQHALLMDRGDATIRRAAAEGGGWGQAARW